MCHFFPSLLPRPTSASSSIKCTVRPLNMNGLCIHTHTSVYIFFIEACLYDSGVTGPSVHTHQDSSCLPAPLEWSRLVRQTVTGEGSVGILLCVLFVKINHLDGDIWSKFILNSCKSKLLCTDKWCNRTTPQVWKWSAPRTTEYRS